MAPPILSFENLGLVQGAGWLFRGLDLHVGERDRLALIGRNGAGKTTLLKLIGGLIEPDEGKRSTVSGTHVVMLEQDPDVSGFATLRDFAAAGERAPALHEIEAIADQIGIDLSREAASASGGERRRAGIGAGHIAARRADQPPRHRGDRLAGKLAQPLFGRVHHDQP